MKSKLSFLILLIFPLLFTSGCGTNPQYGNIENEEELIEKAKEDLISYVNGTSPLSPVDMVTDMIQVADSEFNDPLLHEFETCEIYDGKIFDYIDYNNIDDAWAVELKFNGIDKETNETSDGVAILYYCSWKEIIAGGPEVEKKGEMYLISIASTEDEIKFIRNHWQNTFNSMKKAQKLFPE